MCGIISYAKGTKPEYDNVLDVIDSGLKRLTYRGYDSWGIATSKETTAKKVGEYTGDTDLGSTTAEAAIGHVRWATHGGVTEANAHPHESCKGRFAVVHNGVIENYEIIKEDILSKDELDGETFSEGHAYTSETDTEIIPHLLEQYVDEERDVAEALYTIDKKLVGNYAIVVLDRETEDLYALKQGSPLVFGFERETSEEAAESNGTCMPASKGAYFASDLYALSDKIDEAFFMKDGDIIMTSGGNLALMRNGEWTDQWPQDEWKDFEWTEEKPELGKHTYWMEKEIKEIPESLKRLSNSLLSEQEQKFKELKSKIQRAEKVILTGSGTSYHATLLAVYYLQKNLDVEAQTLIASEFDNFERTDKDTLLIAVSQSGETRDVLDAINSAEQQGAEIASLVNVPYSTIQRKSDISLEIKAQQENCVAATKTFANQVYTLMNLAGCQNIEEIPQALEEEINYMNTSGMVDAGEFHKEEHEDIYIIGNASTYPIAREIALKLKEIPYVHAEGMMAGELKHGTLALIEEGTPVICLDDGTGNIESTVEEVEARGARTKTLKNKDGNSEEFVFQSTIYGFFLALHWAHKKDLPVDRPRNLAKSVTVK